MLNYGAYNKIIRECKQISISKNKDYGTDVLKKFGPKGLIPRINDKVERLNQLVWYNQEPHVKTEKIEDTLKDLINYSIYLIMILDDSLEKRG